MLFIFLLVNSFLLRRLINTVSLYQSSTTHHFKYIKMRIAIQYYPPPTARSCQRTVPFTSVH